MPSSFSPSLRLELIAPGEQAGAWGSTTNTNLGTLVESSIAGYQTVSVTSASQVLTYANGAADQSRSAMLRLTTGLSSAFSVYAPPVSKQYTVSNDSAHAATIYNSTAPGNTTPAGAGVTIPAGKTLAVYSDGANFRTIDVAALTGVLGVADGGTGATAAPAARANLGTVNDPGVNGILVRTAANSTAPRAVAVSGTGLSVTNGDGVAGNPTIASNATSVNTPSTVVARDAAGNFSAGTINANLTGNVTGSLTGGSVTTSNATITGGSITGINDLAVADGGTGASSAIAARTNLGLAIGIDVLSPVGNGSGLTQLNASQLTSGFVPIERSGTLRLMHRQTVFSSTETGNAIDIPLPTSLFGGRTPTHVMFSASASADGFSSLSFFQVSTNVNARNETLLGASAGGGGSMRVANTFVLPYSSTLRVSIVLMRVGGSYGGTTIDVVGFQM